MKHTEGKAALNPGDLIVIEFHGIDSAAAVFVIAGVRSEDAGKQNPGTGSSGVGRVWICHYIPPGQSSIYVLPLVNVYPMGIRKDRPPGVVLQKFYNSGA